MTTGEIARRCGVTVPTVKKWIRDGQLSAFRTPGGHYRVADEAFRVFAARAGLPEGTRDPSRAAQILVVDDDRRFLEVATEMLRRLEPGWKVDIAEDGYEALLRIGLALPDVLVLDLRMPQLDGLTVCRRLRADPLLRGIRIVTVTGYADEQTEAEARTAGADAFLEKPVDLLELRACVARLLGGTPAKGDVGK